MADRLEIIERHRALWGVSQLASVDWYPEDIDYLLTEIKRLTKERAPMVEMLTLVDEVVRHSEGVAGWHMNGDVASWDELGIANDLGVLLKESE